jgi:hypothetical protein
VLCVVAYDLSASPSILRSWRDFMAAAPEHSYYKEE